MQAVTGTLCQITNNEDPFIWEAFSCFYEIENNDNEFYENFVLRANMSKSMPMFFMDSKKTMS